MNDFSMQAGIEHDGEVASQAAIKCRSWTTVLVTLILEHYQSQMPSKRDARGRVRYFLSQCSLLRQHRWGV